MCRGALGGVYFLSSAHFWIFKSHVLASRTPTMTSDKKVMKTKNLPLDRDLSGAWPQIQATTSNWSSRAKKPVLQQFPLFMGSPLVFDSSRCCRGNFLGYANKNTSKPGPKNLFRCLELKKSVNNAYLAI